jgi:hypothetical protein
VLCPHLLLYVHRIAQLSQPILGLARAADSPDGRMSNALIESGRDPLNLAQATCRGPSGPMLAATEQLGQNASAMCTGCWSKHCKCDEKYNAGSLCMTCFDMPCACMMRRVDEQYPAVYLDRIPPYRNDS